jgi:TolB-like protein
MSTKRRASKLPDRLADEPARPASVSAPSDSLLDRIIGRLKTLKGAIVAIAGVGAVLGGLAGYWNAYQAARSSTQSSAQLLALVGKGDAGPLSIVVLPFANLTGDPQQAYMADGITAAVTADLSRIRDAFIVSTATAFAYKDKAVTLQQIGKELGVRFALQGGVQRSGDKIRINAQLADTTNNAQLWSESFDGSQRDLFALQEIVTARIGNSIGREMVVVAARDSERHSGDPRAADLMMRASALSLNPIGLATYEESENLYRQALLLQPNNARVLAGLAASLSVPAANGFIVDAVAREQKLVEARDLALKAKALDPSLPSVYVTLSDYADTHGDYEGARRASETALSLEPKNPWRYSNLAADYLMAGEATRAIELLAKAVHLDPRHVPDGALSLFQFRFDPERGLWRVQ